MTITRDKIDTLRSLTNCPSTECRKALIRTNGDMNAASELLLRFTRTGRWQDPGSDLTLRQQYKIAVVGVALQMLKDGFIPYNILGPGTLAHAAGQIADEMLLEDLESGQQPEPQGADGGVDDAVTGVVG